MTSVITDHGNWKGEYYFLYRLIIRQLSHRTGDRYLLCEGLELIKHMPHAMRHVLAKISLVYRCLYWI